MRIGILGGTFNPIHNGHLYIAQIAMDRLNIDKVLFIPVGNPPHKEKSSLLPEHIRYTMAVLATLSIVNFEVCAIELTQRCLSYTYKTLQRLHKFYPNAAFYFIIGWDTIFELLMWRKLDVIGKLCKVIAVSRPGYTLTNLPKLPIEPEYIEVEGLDISSTKIRQYIKEGKPVDSMIPELVKLYIEKYGLYRDMPTAEK